MTPAELRAARETLGLTQLALAEALECTPRTVQMWEAGDRNVPGPARVALAFMLRTPARRWPVSWHPVQLEQQSASASAMSRTPTITTSHAARVR